MGRLHLPPAISPGSLSPEIAPNGTTPTASFLRRAADGMNTIATGHKKVVQLQSQYLLSFASGSSSVIYPWRCYFRTGENTVGLRLLFGLADTDYGAATNPRVEFTVYTAAGVVVQTKTFNYNGRNAPADYYELPNRTNFVTATLTGLSANTEYFLLPTVRDGARVLFLTAWEVADLHADDGVAGVVDPTKFLTDGPIYDEHVEDLLDAGDKHWRHGGCHYLTWNPDYDEQYVTISATSYTNVIDLSSTSRTAATPGVTLPASYHGHAATGSAGPGVRIAVNAVRATGTGSLSVRMTDGTNNIDLTGITTAGPGDWYVGNGNIPQTTTKWDIQARVTSGTFRLYAVCLYAYEAGP